MAAHIHLSGFGLVGALMALRLEDAGLAFTWSDPERPVTAWRASTGCCYPSDDPEDRANYHRFEREVAEHAVLGPFVERAQWSYPAGRATPHVKRDQTTHRFGAIALAREPSYHIDAQKVVEAVRARFRAQRRAPPAGAQIVHSHGFHHQGGTTRLFWGWHAKCHARVVCPRLREHLAGRRLAINLQHQRYGMWYLYPVPGDRDGRFYCGSSLIMQRRARQLDVAPKLARMLAHARSVLGGVIDIAPTGANEVGWRPQPSPGSALPPAWRGSDGAIWLRPQYASGFRHHLTQADALRGIIS